MKKAIKEAEDILKKASISEYKQEAKLIAEVASGLSYEEILLESEVENKVDVVKKIAEFARLRAKTLKPIQYILNCAYFMASKYYVDENVLIPRVETELLILKAFEKVKDINEKIDILDIGTGSGCIALELAKKLKDKDIEILAVDKSIEALETALINLQKFDLVRKVLFRKSDLFSKVRDCEKFDLIVSNPPYIPFSEENNLQIEVKFEPKSALFAANDGLEFYQKIIATAPKFLKPQGFLAFELGINQSEKVKKMLEKDFKDIEIYKDLADIDRVIIAQLS